MSVSVTRQLLVERRAAKVRRSKTDVLPLCHATSVLLLGDVVHIVISQSPGLTWSYLTLCPAASSPVLRPYMFSVDYRGVTEMIGG